MSGLSGWRGRLSDNASTIQVIQLMCLSAGAGFEWLTDFVQADGLQAFMGHGCERAFGLAIWVIDAIMRGQSANASGNGLGCRRRCLP